MDRAGATRTFLRNLARAEAKTAESAWEEAASLWTQVVAVNPVEGRFWTHLAEARRHAKDYRGAIAAYEKALDLRDGYPAETAYRIACCQALLGEKVAALDWLERALQLGYRDLQLSRTDDDLANLREDERFRELVGLVDTRKLSRDEGWGVDLQFLAREIKRRAHDPYRYATREQFDAAVAELNAAIPRLTDLEIVVEMNRLLRQLGDGHAWVWPPNDNEEFQQRLPVQFVLFEEGLFVVAADLRHADLLGSEVLRFDDLTTVKAMTAVDSIVHRDNENRQWPRYVVPRLLSIVPLLHALGVAQHSHKIVLTIRDMAGETRQVVLRTIVKRPTALNLPYPEGSCAEDWTYFPETLPGEPPLYLRNMHAPYWFTYLREEGIVYFQFNAVRDNPSESLAEFSDRLFRFIDHHEVDKLVIDIRLNHGGNTFLELPLLHRLIGSKVNQRGQLFVIIGRATFSAAQNFASLLDKHTYPIFVGEPTGSSPTFIGETVEFELPYSKTSVNVSDLLWQGTWPMDDRVWIAPTIYTPPTFAALRDNCDPALEAILACPEHLPGW